MPPFTRRSTLALPAGAVAAPSSIARAPGKTVTIGIDCNADCGPGGWRLNPLMLDDGTATTGQYDPAQAAINARRERVG
jgi:hypothetical protein